MVHKSHPDPFPFLQPLLLLQPLHLLQPLQRRLKFYANKMSVRFTLGVFA